MNYNEMNPIYSEENRPLSPWAYIGYQILFGLPVIGFIICIIIAVSAVNKNARNFAAAQIIITVSVAVLSIVLCLVFGISMAGIAQFFESGGQ